MTATPATAPATPEIAIRRVEGRTALYEADPYQRSTGGVCGVALCLDPEGEPPSLYCETYSPGQGTSQREWHGRLRTWRIPTLTDEAANDLMREVAPLAARVAAGYESRYDDGSNLGSNLVGCLDEDAAEAEREIARICECAGRDEWSLCRVWDAGDWLRDARDSDLGLSASTTDAQLAAMVERVEGDTSPGECDRIDGVEAYLERRRQDLRDDRTEIKASALAAAHWTQTQTQRDAGQADCVESSYSPGCWEIWERTTNAEGGVSYRVAACPDVEEGGDEEELACDAAARVEANDWTEGYIDDDR